jgi:hypothetical protein
MDWLQVVWNRRHEEISSACAVDAFGGHLTLNANSVLHAVNTDLVVIPGGMAL